MRKYLLRGIGAFVFLVVIGIFYLNNRNRTLSPSGFSELENNGLIVSVEYSRPSVRDRLIFGSKEEGALLIYGEYWRLGANEPTLLKVNRDFNFNGAAVPAGEYAMYAIPLVEGFEIRLNSELRLWGVNEPDYSLDVLKTTIKHTMPTSPTEQFTIETVARESGVNLVFSWSDRIWEVMITGQ